MNTTYDPEKHYERIGSQTQYIFWTTRSWSG